MYKRYIQQGKEIEEKRPRKVSAKKRSLAGCSDILDERSVGRERDFIK